MDRQLLLDGTQALIEFIVGPLLARCAYHEHPQTRPGLLRIERTQNRKRVGDIGAAPPASGLGDPEIATRGRAAALQFYSGTGDTEHLACLMFGQHAGDVIVDDHDLVDLTKPLLREHSDRRGAAARAHTQFVDPVHDGSVSGLHDDGGSAVHCQLERATVAEGYEGIAGHAPFLFRSAGEVVHAAQRKHLRAVFARRDVPNRLTYPANGYPFRPHVTVAAHLTLHPTV